MVVKSLLLNFPLRDYFRKCSSFQIFLSTKDSETDAAPDGTSTVTDETSTVLDETNVVPDGLLGSRRYFALMNPTLVMGFRHHA